jgi:hypothetical protein
LYRAWKKTIRDHYQLQQINSERGLQVFFCAALLKEFDKAGVRRRIFVEPGLKTPRGSGGPKPDVLICNRNKIIGVVELKYLPRTGAKVAKDLRTLEWVASHQDHISISNARFLGIVQDERRYSLAADAVLCWAGVHRGQAGLLLQSRVSSRVRPRFMELHAVTSADEDPEIVSSYRPTER